MALKNFWHISEIFFASTALSSRVFSCFKQFLPLGRSQVVSFSTKQRRQKVWKFINCTLKDIMSTKTMKELCVSQRFSFVFWCRLSASAGNLLKFFSHCSKNWSMWVICHVGKWAEIAVNDCLSAFMTVHQSISHFVYQSITQSIVSL